MGIVIDQRWLTERMDDLCENVEQLVHDIDAKRVMEAMVRLKSIAAGARAIERALGQYPEVVS